MWASYGAADKGPLVREGPATVAVNSPGSAGGNLVDHRGTRTCAAGACGNTPCGTISPLLSLRGKMLSDVIFGSDDHANRLLPLLDRNSEPAATLALPINGSAKPDLTFDKTTLSSGNRERKRHDFGFRFGRRLRHS